MDPSAPFSFQEEQEKEDENEILNFITFPEDSGGNFDDSAPQSQASRLLSAAESSRRDEIEHVSKQQTSSGDVIQRTGAESSSSSFRRLMAERLRRERLTQNFADLHKMLPPIRRVSKNSIVQSAAEYVDELQRQVGELRKKNEELNSMVAAKHLQENQDEEELVNIKVSLERLRYSSLVHSANSVLRCLKDMNVSTRKVKFVFSGVDMVILVGFEKGVINSADIERALRMSLMEAEQK